MEARSFISTEDYIKLFAPIWTDVTGQLRKHHPAPYPLDIPRRLIRMFSFAGDTVLDPFGGTGTTALAAAELGRDSISVEIEPKYVDLIEDRFGTQKSAFTQIEVRRSSQEPLKVHKRQVSTR